MNKIALIITILILIILGSCSTNINSLLKEAVNIEDYETEQSLTEKLTERNYTNIRITQKIVLTMKNKQYDFITYTALALSNKFRIIFLTDMGNTVLEFIYLNDNLNVISNLAEIPEELILNGFCKDIQHIYGSVLTGWDTELYMQENEYLLYNTDVENREIFYFDEDGYIYKSLYSTGKRIISNVFYSNFIDNIPQNIYVENIKYDYTIEIKLLDIKLLPDADKVFTIP